MNIRLNSIGVKSGDLFGSEGIVAQGADWHSEAIMNKEIILARMQALQSMKVMGFNALYFFLWILYSARVISIFLPFFYAWGSPITIFNAGTQTWLGVFIILFICIPDPLYHKIPTLFSFRGLLEVMAESLFVLGVFIYLLIKIVDKGEKAVFSGPGFWLFLSAFLLSSVVKFLNFRFSA